MWTPSHRKFKPNQTLTILTFNGQRKKNTPCVSQWYYGWNCSRNASISNIATAISKGKATLRIPTKHINWQSKHPIIIVLISIQLLNDLLERLWTLKSRQLGKTHVEQLSPTTRALSIKSNVHPFAHIFLSFYIFLLVHLLHSPCQQGLLFFSMEAFCATDLEIVTKKLKMLPHAFNLTFSMKYCAQWQHK